MTSSVSDPRPSDRLLVWLSARGRASDPTVERACRAIADRFDPIRRIDRSPTHQYLNPLRRLGHIEAVRGGFSVVPTTLCWSCRLEKGVFLGGRDEFMLAELSRRLGPGFVASPSDSPWPATWCAVGRPEAVEAAMEGLGIVIVREPGMRLLASLPTLEDAIAAWADAGPPSALIRWEIADHVRGQWSPTEGLGVVNGLIRPSGNGRRIWMIVREGVGRLLDSPEKRAVAWWAELARLVRPHPVLDRKAGRLLLPASRLPPPLMVERPLIWASGSPPSCDSSRGLRYEAIDPGRAGEVARILGLSLEDSA